METRSQRRRQTEMHQETESPRKLIKVSKQQQTQRKTGPGQQKKQNEHTKSKLVPSRGNAGGEQNKSVNMENGQKKLNKQWKLLFFGSCKMRISRTKPTQFNSIALQRDTGGHSATRRQYSKQSERSKLIAQRSEISGRNQIHYGQRGTSLTTTSENPGYYEEERQNGNGQVHRMDVYENPVTSWLYEKTLPRWEYERLPLQTDMFELRQRPYSGWSAFSQRPSVSATYWQPQHIYQTPKLSSEAGSFWPHWHMYNYPVQRGKPDDKFDQTRTYWSPDCRYSVPSDISSPGGHTGTVWPQWGIQTHATVHNEMPVQQNAAPSARNIVQESVLQPRNNVVQNDSFTSYNSSSEQFMQPGPSGQEEDLISTQFFSASEASIQHNDILLIDIIDRLLIVSNDEEEHIRKILIECNGVWECQFCLAYASSDDELFLSRIAEHESIHNACAGRKCFCELIFTQPKDLKRHIVDTHLHFIYRCCFLGCTAKRLEFRQIVAHIRTEHSHTQDTVELIGYTCVICGKVSQGRYRLYSHYEKKHFRGILKVAVREQESWRVDKDFQSLLATEQDLTCSA